MHNPGREPNKAAFEVLELLFELDWFESQPELFYHRLLEIVVDLIPEARWGTVSLIDDQQWRYIAAIGHDLAGLLTLELKPEWDLSQSRIQRLESIQRGHDQTFPPVIQQHFQKSVRPSSATLIGAYVLDSGMKVALTVDIPEGQNREFSLESEHTFEAFLKLAGKYQSQVERSRQLENINHSLELSYSEVSRLSDKLRQVLNLSSELGEGREELKDFFDHLLQAALEVVEQADYGSVSVIEGDTWKFLSAKGHDLGLLQKLPLKASYVYLSNEPVEIIDIQTKNEQSMPVELFRDFQRATRPIQSSLIINLPINDRVRVNVTLDIRQGSSEIFPPSTKRILLAFARLATGYLKIRVHAEAMKKAYQSFAERLARVAEVHDPETGLHNRRVLCEEIETFAGLHDIGKVFIDTDILNKESSLSPEEFREVQKHTLFSEELLNDPFFSVARNISLYHHERFDGSGYPYGLKGDEIPLEAQIVAIADVYDALRSKRSYKNALGQNEAMGILRRGDNRVQPQQFNQLIVDSLESILESVEKTCYSL